MVRRMREDGPQLLVRRVVWGVPARLRELDRRARLVDEVLQRRNLEFTYWKDMKGRPACQSMKSHLGSRGGQEGVLTDAV